ncbi:MBL fold metallo-hydrolase [Rubrivivax sp. RP6-9]|uniref:MBL fold metallo-hydrolase n=1 Tax=Rubrivivax sp. RP6-9 TaxID=3415750 RepID=UPI003CC6961A
MIAVKSKSLARLLARCISTFLSASVCVGAIAEVASPVLAINDATAKSAVTVRALRGSVSVLEGAGGNIGVLSTQQGQLLVDAGIAVARPRIEAALKGLGGGAPKWLINTHWHWDHTDGNPWVAELGATIVSHERTRMYLAKRTNVIEWGYSFPALPETGLPKVVFQTSKTMEFGGETIHLKHFGTGHTDGDAIVHFVNADVLFMGDIWWNGHYPFIDYGAGGDIDGMIRWTREALAIAGPKTLIVPGHGPAGGRAQLAEYLDMLIDVRTRVARLKGEGKSLAQVLESQPTQRYDAKWGAFVLSPYFFTQLVYMGV